MNCSPPPRCEKAAEAPLKNAPLQQLFHNVLVQIEIHLSLLYALNRSNSKAVPNFVGRDNPSRPQNIRQTATADSIDDRSLSTAVPRHPRFVVLHQTPPLLVWKNVLRIP